MTAEEIRAYRNMNAKLVKVEELDRLMVNLTECEVGFRDEEEFMRKEEMKLKGMRGQKLKRDMVLNIMKTKIRYNRI